MTELRYNPLLGDWTMVADKRQFRPNMPQDFCPFCPGSGRVPEHYEVLKYDNDFPALLPDPPEPSVAGTGPYRVEKSYGKCEVILYSPDHRATLLELSVAHIVKLVDLWTERYIELNRDPRHQYVMIFENRGEEVGVTMPHPHGQIYAYSQMPLKIKTELANCWDHYDKTGQCLLCDMNRTEEEFGKRIIYENEHFLAYLPFFTDYPFGLFIVSKAHKTGLDEFTSAEKESLARSLKEMIGAMDTLFERPFPYMMVLHQRPARGEETRDYYHFHIEFYPPLREKNKIKYYASSEMGAWAACNTQAVEQTAAALRQAHQNYLKKQP
ncbi:galactose-1-phosphate uridylyltransferase [Peptococcaceae bacterium CEB3]|nr:galactose-1-phosphate uridylyltransferase [Peptococcaceae bacterium CEB3]